MEWCGIEARDSLRVSEGICVRIWKYKGIYVVRFGSVRYCMFQLKTEPNRLVLKKKEPNKTNLIDFFFDFWFFFFGWFSVFLSV